MNATKTIRASVATVALTAGAVLFGGMDIGTAAAQDNLEQIGLAALNDESAGDVRPGDVLLERWQRSGVADLADWQATYGSGGSAAPAGSRTFTYSHEMKWDNTAQ